jgi:3-hydroxybutyryl-CoA dehydrogenase
MDSEMVITIIGAGTMGHALALIFAQGGNRVFLTDISERILKQARELIRSHLKTLADSEELRETPDLILKRIETSTDYKTFVRESDLAIEAIVEEVEAKRKLFNEMADHIGNRTIVTSNTSYLNIFPLAPASIQKRLLITHFFNPPYIVPLVEVVGSPEVDPELISRVCHFLKSSGLTPVALKKFVPGYIVNRLQRALGREVLYMIDEGFADPEEIDHAVKASLGVRLPILGVVARYDHAGLDMAVRALKAPPIGLATEDRLSPTLLKLVEEGHLGVKSGKGFFDYSDKPLEELLRERDRKLLKVRRLLRDLGEIQ